MFALRIFSTTPRTPGTSSTPAANRSGRPRFQRSTKSSPSTTPVASISACTDIIERPSKRRRQASYSIG
jgi:hypothetical protein